MDRRSGCGASARARMVISPTDGRVSFGAPDAAPLATMGLHHWIVAGFATIAIGTVSCGSGDAASDASDATESARCQTASGVNEVTYSSAWTGTARANPQVRVLVELCGPDATPETLARYY